IAALAYGSWHLATPPAAQPVPTAVVQSGVGRGLRWRTEYVRFGLDDHLRLSREAATSHPVLVVWPEYAVSFYLQELIPERDELLAGARALAADLVLGGPSYQFTPAGETTYRNSVFVLRRGIIAGRYDKRRLVPFAETTGHTPYTPGTAASVFA